MKPRRVQRRRARGWRMPPKTVYVGRGSKWGNPFRVGDGRTANEAVDCYREFLQIRRIEVGELRGKNLCCWCRLDQPCHADVLLELANGEGGDA